MPSDISDAEIVAAGDLLAGPGVLKSPPSSKEAEWAPEDDPTIKQEGCGLREDTSTAPDLGVFGEVLSMRTEMREQADSGFVSGTVVLCISACLICSVVVGSALAIPFLALYVAYDGSRSYMRRRKKTRNVSGLRVVSGRQGE